MVLFKETIWTPDGARLAHHLVDKQNGGFWVKVKFKDYPSRLTYIHNYIEFWALEVFRLDKGRTPLNFKSERWTWVV